MAVDETGKVTFTPEEQAEVDRVVGERLGREKAKYADYEDLKEIESSLGTFGYQGTPAEKKAAIKQQAEQYRKEAELEALQNEAKMTGTSPELMAEMKALKDKIVELEKPFNEQKKQEEAKKLADESWGKQVAEFEVKYKDIDLPKLSKNPDFMEFFEGSNPNLTISQVYERFEKFVGNANAEAIAKVKSKEERSTPGGKGARNSDGNTYGLTDSQRKEVDTWNKRYPKMPMSYKEYANQ